MTTTRLGKASGSGSTVDSGSAPYILAELATYTIIRETVKHYRSDFTFKGTAFEVGHPRDPMFGMASTFIIADLVSSSVRKSGE